MVSVDLKRLKRLTEDELVTRPDAAELLKLKVQTLAVWSLTGKHLPVIRCGRSVRYKLSDIEKFIEKQTTPAAS